MSQGAPATSKALERDRIGPQDPRGAAQAASRRRYAALIEEFQESLLVDRFGAASDVAAVVDQDSLIPPAPPTWRGRLGSLLVRWQVRALWWAVRSFRLRDRALESVWQSLEAHLLEQGRRDSRLAAIEERVQRLERLGRA